MFRTVLANKSDNVVTAVNEIAQGMEYSFNSGDSIVIGKTNEAIQFCHKIAISDIRKGDPIIKYGEIIGNASKDILKGDWVHVHNLESNRGRGDKEKGSDQ